MIVITFFHLFYNDFHFGCPFALLNRWFIFICLYFTLSLYVPRVVFFLLVVVVVAAAVVLFSVLAMFIRAYRHDSNLKRSISSWSCAVIAFGAESCAWMAVILKQNINS